MTLKSVRTNPGIASALAVGALALAGLIVGVAVLTVGGGGANYSPSLFSQPYKTACSYSLSAENSLDEATLRQTMGRAHMGFFAQNDDIFKGIVNAGEKYAISNVYIASHAGLESAYGKSPISKKKKNLFGYGARDSSPGQSANSFNSYSQGTGFIMGKIKNNYLSPSGKYYVDEAKLLSLDKEKIAKAEEIKQINHITKIIGATLPAMNVYYASDKEWAKKINSIMSDVFKKAGVEGKYAGSCQPQIVDFSGGDGEKIGRGITPMPTPTIPSLAVREEKRIKYLNRGEMTPQAIVLHYTAGKSFAGLISALESRNPPNGLACHIGVDTDGTAYQMMDSLEEKSACAPGINGVAIQIEIVGNSEQDLLTNTSQQKTVIRLVNQLIKKYNINARVFANSTNPSLKELKQIKQKRGIYSHKIVDEYLNKSGKGKTDPGDKFMEIIKKAIEQ